MRQGTLEIPCVTSAQNLPFFAHSHLKATRENNAALLPLVTERDPTGIRPRHQPFMQHLNALVGPVRTDKTEGQLSAPDLLEIAGLIEIAPLLTQLEREESGEIHIHAIENPF